MISSRETYLENMLALDCALIATCVWTYTIGFKAERSISFNPKFFGTMGNPETSQGPPISIMDLAMSKGKRRHVVVDGVICRSIIQISSNSARLFPSTDAVSPRLPLAFVIDESYPAIRVHDERQTVPRFGSINRFHSPLPMSTSGHIPNMEAPSRSLPSTRPKVNVKCPFIVRVCLRSP